MFLGLGILFVLIELLTIGAFILLFMMKKMELSKKNNFFFVPVVLLIFTVYCVNKYFLADDATIFDYLRLIGRSIKFLVFDLDSTNMNAITHAYPIYYVVYFLLLIIVSLAWLTTIFSFFGRKIKGFIRNRRLLKNSCDIVIGYSKDSIHYAVKNGNTLLWVECIGKKEIEDLQNRKIAFLVHKLNTKYLKKLLCQNEYHMILFKDTNKNFLDIIYSLTGYTSNSHKIYLHFEASLEEMKLVQQKYISTDLLSDTIFINFFNKHETLAFDFIQKYPISKYIPRNFYQPNFTISHDKKINICFIGFGNVNIALFKAMSIVYQLAEETEDKKLKTHPIHFFAYDAERKQLHNEYFTKLEFDYENIFKNTDMPAIEKICNLSYENMYVETSELKKKLVEMVHKDSFTYFIVSLDNDSQNLSYADSLYFSIDEFKDNFKIFTRIKDNKIKDVKNISNNIIYFGEDATYYQRNRIINEDLMKLSGLVNSSYRALSKENLYQSWQKSPIVEQYSNIYGALITFHKLGLMNLELVSKDYPKESVTKVEYEQIYGSIDLEKNNQVYNTYSFYFENNVKNVLAFLEHSRWNASYFLFDFKPMRFEEFVFNEKSKSLTHKIILEHKHACLTTYYALDILIKTKYKMLKEKKEEATKLDYQDSDFLSISQIYRYDYMVMDNLFNILDDFNLKIVK